MKLVSAKRQIRAGTNTFLLIALAAINNLRCERFQSDAATQSLAAVCGASQIDPHLDPP
jgi:hypothetical protein